MRPLRVAVVGAGPVAQAIHLPTLARCGDQVQVTAVVDPDVALAQAVAAPLRAQVWSSLEDCLAEAELDLAVVGSPNRFHAAQLAALSAAGVRGLLAEKPLVTTLAEADHLEETLRANGTHLVVGAMHTYDPAWLAARDWLDWRRGTTPAADGSYPGGPYHVRCSCYIPTNDRFEDMATTMVRPVPPAAAPTRPAPSATQLISDGILGLATHNLPHFRLFLPQLTHLAHASVIPPWGYVMSASGPAGTAELIARTGGTWRPDWTLDIFADDFELHASFPPSYVHGGSAVITIQAAEAVETLRFGPYPSNGYEAEWRELIGLVADGTAPRYSLSRVFTDMRYALSLVDLVTATLASAEQEVAA